MITFDWQNITLNPPYGFLNQVERRVLYNHAKIIVSFGQLQNSIMIKPHTILDRTVHQEL